LGERRVSGIMGRGDDGRRGAVSLSKSEEKRLADKALLRSSAINALLIGLWYMFSLTISIVSTYAYSYIMMLVASEEEIAVLPLATAVREWMCWTSRPGLDNGSTDANFFAVQRMDV
jgi:hypothetical protein